MGHEKDMHKLAYRIHTAAIEKGKVGRVLTAVDSGDIAGLQGKKLKDLQCAQGYSFYKYCF
jgi:hypothetical protein